MKLLKMLIPALLVAQFVLMFINAYITVAGNSIPNLDPLLQFYVLITLVQIMVLRAILSVSVAVLQCLTDRALNVGASQ